MRVLWVATYPELGASSRYRVCQFLPELEKLGVESTFLPLFSNEFFQGFYRPGHALQKAAGLLEGCLRRVEQVARARRYDVVVVQREAAIIGPPFFEYLARNLAGRPIVYDVDDAIFTLQSETNKVSAHARLARALKFPQKSRQIAQLASTIVVANDYLADWAKKYNDNITIMPTVVDGRVFRPKAEKNNPVPVIGWIGTHSTVVWLEQIASVFSRLAKKHDYRLKIVGAGRDIQIDGVRIENKPWRLEDEVEDYRNLDIGVSPLPDDEWAKGKSGFKQHIYMACGLPQVSTRTDGVARFIQEGSEGYFASTQDEWFDKLDRLLADAQLRREVGGRARAHFDTGSNLESETPHWKKVLEHAASESPSRKWVLATL